MVRIRELEPVDLSLLTDFWNRNVSNDPVTQTLLKEKVFDDINFDSGLTLIAFDEEQITAFMQGIVREYKNELRGWIKLFATEQKYRRQGLATHLLQKIEHKMTSRHVKRIGICDSIPNYLQPGLDPFYTEAVTFVERAGYQKHGDTCNLKADLLSRDLTTDADEREARQRGILIQRATLTEQPMVDRFLEKYFLAWKYEVNNMFKQEPIALHLAFLDENLVAFSGHNGNNFNTGWFGPMGTDPTRRGLGIGGILLKRCLQDIKEQGLEAAIIPWVGPIPFYMHYVNAAVHRVFWRYEKIIK